MIEPRPGQLLALATEANQRGWWEDYADALTPDYLEFLGLEAEATAASEWHLGVIPGLLQTEEYARQIHLDFQRAIPTPPGIIEQRIQVRMLRQKILTAREPPLDRSIRFAKCRFAHLAFGGRKYAAHRFLRCYVVRRSRRR